MARIQRRKRRGVEVTRAPSPSMLPAPSPPPKTPPGPGATPADLAVLDTQVVLDWLVFHDPTTLALGRAIEHGSLRWLASQPMLGEIEQVLDRGVGAARLPDRAAIREVCARLAHPAAVAAASALRCTDPDDQMFIDLALAAGARWLFTRDKALLRLAARARAGGVWVLRPADWQQAPDPRDAAPGGAHPGTKRPPEGGP
jgi:putative PIN family toxin of toxin-antitoxin system